MLVAALSFVSASFVSAPALADAGDLSAYLKARAADGDGRVTTAASDYARALADAPDNPLIAIRAYREALEAGDDALADRAAAVLTKAGVAPVDAPLIALAAAVRGGDLAATDGAVARLADGPLVVLTPSLRAWIAFARGGDPFAPLDAAITDPIARRFASGNRALLMIATGKPDEGLTALRALAGTGGAGIDLRINAAQLLFGIDRADSARSLLSGNDPALMVMRQASGVKPSLAFGVSRLLGSVAADLATGNPSPLSIALTRAAVRAEPGNDRAALLLADTLARSGSTDRALAVIDAFPRASPLSSQAIAARITILAAADRDAEALAAARKLAEAKGSNVADWQRYGDQLIAANRFDNAAIWYARVVADPAIAGEWAAWLQLGGALERGGKWPEARAALEKAVALAPDQPLALNYLGYARIERGEALEESAAMLERASALSPQDSSITDSLGWAYHLIGNTARGLPLIERAAAGDPTNAEINEHLGDAYWTVGRRYEARYAWRAAAMVADSGGTVRLAMKIATGLPATAKR